MNSPPVHVLFLSRSSNVLLLSLLIEYSADESRNTICILIHSNMMRCAAFLFAVGSVVGNIANECSERDTTDGKWKIAHLYYVRAASTCNIGEYGTN